jgi:hypothetical protein
MLHSLSMLKILVLSRELFTLKKSKDDFSKSLSQQRIAQTLGLSVRQVRRIEAKALAKVKAQLLQDPELMAALQARFTNHRPGRGG